MLAIFDVQPTGERRFTGSSDAGARAVIDGSQALAQSLVAASKALPERSVRSAHAVFARPLRAEAPIDFDVDVFHAGRSFATAVVTVSQEDRACATVTVLLDRPGPDVVRHADAPPPAADPLDAIEVAMPMEGRELRVDGVADPNDPAEIGPPELLAWLRYSEVPARDDLAKALLAHFTGHLGISTTLRHHAGVGTAMAHRAISTAVLTIGVAFHEPVRWDGWLLYRHESAHAGAGLSYVRGQVFTEGGDLLASFTQEGMIRAMAPEDEQAVPAAARL
ncbi:MAG: thioesterase family protein [Actinomycetota bacterium]|nr:thioesterase family protein [Acidimicrobiia bacterium]MDQ3294428.1 thioesterase family protein [Actinomycetota bacterium]